MNLQRVDEPCGRGFFLSHRDIAWLMACLAGLGILFAPQLFNDGDTLMHIRAGEWMIAHRALLTNDPFSLRLAGQPWQTHEWLAQVLMALTYRLGGFEGLALLCAGAFAGAAGALALCMGERVDRLSQIAITLLALGCASGSLLARPHLLAMPVLVLWSAAHIRAARRHRVPSLWWALLMTLWINLHGSFIIGFAVSAFFALEALARDRSQLKPWVLFGAAALAATLFNPYGLHGLLFPFALASTPLLSAVGEWQPTRLSFTEPFDFALFLALYLSLTRGLRFSAARTVLLLLFLAMAFLHGRHQMIAGILGGLLFAEALEEKSKHNTPSKSYAPASLAFSLMACVAVALRFHIPVTPPQLALLDQVPQDYRSKPVLNDYALGGALIFASIPPYIDSRVELYGQKLLQEYADLNAMSPAEITNYMAQHDIAWVILTPRHPLVRLFDSFPAWKRLLQDDKVIVFVRDESVID